MLNEATSEQRYEVLQPAQVTSFAGRQDTLPVGVVEVQVLSTGEQVTALTTGVHLDLVAGEIKRLLGAGMILKL